MLLAVDLVHGLDDHLDLVADLHVVDGRAPGQLAEHDDLLVGQLAEGTTVDDVKVRTTVELVVEPLYEFYGVENLIYRWKKVAS